MKTFNDSRFCKYSDILILLYKIRWVRPLIIYIILKVEGGQFYSGTLRRILFRYHKVDVGEYSYGSCIVPGRWPAGVKIGRYTSIGQNVEVFLRNHPKERLSMHPFFYNKNLGFLSSDNISSGSLEIGHDVWIGSNVIFTPGCIKVGNGAIVGAGSVVTKNIPAFAIAAGNPARIIDYRFDEKIQKVIIQSKWWENSIEKCLNVLDEMVKPLSENCLSHPFLNRKKL